MARKTYRRGDQDFVNPYHFVPLGKECRKSRDYRKIKDQPGLLTGWIECTLETKTPLFIPNTTNDDVFGMRDQSGNPIKSYDFCSRDDLAGKTNPPPPGSAVIPGSELRGMIRSAFEAVTNSCMSTTADDHVLFKRTNTPGKPAIVKKHGNQWILQPCRERIGMAAWKMHNKKPKQDMNDYSDNISKMSEGEEIHFTLSNEKYKAKHKFPAFHFVQSLNGPTKGKLHKGEPIDNKHHESVFVVDANQSQISISERDVQNLLENFKFYRDSTINQHKKMGKHEGYAHIKVEKLNDLDGKLVYYSKHETCRGPRYYLSPAAIGREVFHNRLKDLIGSYTPCEKIARLCPGCVLFGLAGKDEAAVSRVRFGDATPVDGSAPRFLKPMIPPELASPKPSATEFYLTRGEKQHLTVDACNVWNYDYAGKWGRWANEFHDRRDYIPEIRGRKFYWHGSGQIRNLEKNPLLGEEISDRHVKIRPLDKGNVFRFKVHFNQVAGDELKRLIWVLGIGGSTAHGHKLGMGKPVGLGSVSIKPESVNIRRIELSDSELRYAIEPAPGILKEVNEIGVDRERAARFLDTGRNAMDAFLTITTLKNGLVIDYPRPDDKSNIPQEEHPKASYHWFVGNRQIEGSGGKGTSPKIDQELPPIKNPHLKKIVVTVENKGPDRPGQFKSHGGKGRHGGGSSHRRGNRQ